MAIPGGRDVLVAGRPQTVFPGQTLYVVGRGKPTGPLTLSFGEQAVMLSKAHTMPSELAAGVFGQVAVGQLEELALNDVAEPFALQFRVVGKSCSLLMLETEEDYKEFEIPPLAASEKAVRITEVDKTVRTALAEIGDTLGNPKKRFLRWLTSLDKLPVPFEFPQ